MARGPCRGVSFFDDCDALDAVARTEFASIVLHTLLPVAFDVRWLDIEPKLVDKRVACTPQFQQRLSKLTLGYRSD